MAIVGAFGLLASSSAFIGSFLGLTLDKLGKWILVLHGGVFLLALPMVAIEYPAKQANTLFWKDFECGKPRWIRLAIIATFILFAVIFILFALLNHVSSPEIQDGQYVLNNHGNIIRVLSEREYLRLKGWELRTFAAGWICFYVMITAYWWYPRIRRNPDFR